MSGLTKTIIVTLELDIPASATEKDMSDFVDVEFAQCNSMKMDNPCRDNFEIVGHSWRAE